MVCYFVRRLIQAHLGDALATGDGERFRRHCEACASCAAALREAQAAARLVSLQMRVPVPDADAEAMLARVRARGQRRLGEQLLGTLPPMPAPRKNFRIRSGEWWDAFRHGVVLTGFRASSRPLTLPAAATLPIAAALLLMLHQGVPTPNSTVEKMEQRPAVVFENSDAAGEARLRASKRRTLGTPVLTPATPDANGLAPALDAMGRPGGALGGDSESGRGAVPPGVAGGGVTAGRPPGGGPAAPAGGVTGAAGQAYGLGTYPASDPGDPAGKPTAPASTPALKGRSAAPTRTQAANGTSPAAPGAATSGTTVLGTVVIRVQAPSPARPGEPATGRALNAGQPGAARPPAPAPRVRSESATPERMGIQYRDTVAKRPSGEPVRGVASDALTAESGASRSVDAAPVHQTVTPAAPTAEARSRAVPPRAPGGGGGTPGTLGGGGGFSAAPGAPAPDAARAPAMPAPAMAVPASRETPAGLAHAGAPRAAAPMEKAAPAGGMPGQPGGPAAGAMPGHPGTQDNVAARPPAVVASPAPTTGPAPAAARAGKTPADPAPQQAPTVTLALPRAAVSTQNAGDLVQQLRGSPTAAREAAAELGQRKEKRSIGALARALRAHPDAGARQAAADALAAIGTPPALSALRAAAAGNTPGREPARRALDRLRQRDGQ